MKPLSPKQQELKTKWDAIVRKKYDADTGFLHISAASMAQTAIHWQHNVELDVRAGRNAASSEFFRREYTKLATELQLWETLQALDIACADVKEGCMTRQMYDLESAANNLRVALESFEINDKADKLSDSMIEAYKTMNRWVRQPQGAPTESNARPVERVPRDHMPQPDRHHA